MEPQPASRRLLDRVHDGQIIEEGSRQQRLAAATTTPNCTTPTSATRRWSTWCRRGCWPKLRIDSGGSVKTLDYRRNETTRSRNVHPVVEAAGHAGSIASCAVDRIGLAPDDSPDWHGCHGQYCRTHSTGIPLSGGTAAAGLGQIWVDSYERGGRNKEPIAELIRAAQRTSLHLQAREAQLSGARLC
jgi:hypothetical protein